MKDEIVRDYEHDLDFLLREVVRCKYVKEDGDSEMERHIKIGMRASFRGCAFMMLHRLNRLCPEKYNCLTELDRENYLNDYINQIIEEKTNANKKSKT